jgi:hypothetical protein
VIARIEGSWTDKIYYTLGSAPFATAEVISLNTATHDHEITSIYRKSTL